MGVRKIKITHQRNKCIGCGSCAIYAKNRWMMNEADGKADLKDAIRKGDFFIAEIDEHEIEQNKKAENACPVNIIKIEDKKK